MLSNKRAGVGTWTIIALFLAWSLLPLYWLINTAFQSPLNTTILPPRWFPSADVSAFSAAFADPALQKGLVNSLVTAVGATLIAVLLGAFAGYALGLLSQAKNGGNFGFWVLSTRMAPPIAVALPYFVLYGSTNLGDTTQGLILSHIVLVIGVVTWILTESFRAIPREILEAALVDGCGYGSAYFRVMLKLALPGLVGAASIAFLLSWNDFFFALILTNTRAITAPLADYQAIGFQSVDLGALAATSTIVLVPTALVVAFFQKQLVTGMTMGAVKG